MADNSGARHRPFAVINQGTNDAAWDGSPVTLLPDQSVQMAATPDGTTVLVYLNGATENSPATLALTAGGSAPVFLTAPPLPELPSILIRNWKGNGLGITNVTPPHVQVPVDVRLINSALPGPTAATLEEEADAVPLGTGQAARGATLPRWMQLILQAGPPDSSGPSVFAIVGGPPDGSGNNAYVVALNAAQETGPGTGQAPPAGYYATTVGSVYTYQLNWGGASVFVASVSGGDGSVGLRAL
jgi:hypothetical protein